MVHIDCVTTLYITASSTQFWTFRTVSGPFVRLWIMRQSLARRPLIGLHIYHLYYMLYVYIYLRAPFLVLSLRIE